MKAIVFTQYGTADKVQIQERDKPTPMDDEVLVKIHAASLNAGDKLVLQGKPYILRLVFGITKPKYATPGSDFAGEVEAVGSSVTSFQPGDAVYGELSDRGFGALAEYAVVPESILATKPSNLSYEQAAAVPLAAATALQALRDKAQVQAGQRVLINGASGGVGTYAVQIAKHYGAEVTAVCSTRNLDIARANGADHVIDYTQEDFTENGQQYDLIFDLATNRSIARYKQSLTDGGLCLVAGSSLRRLMEAGMFGWWITRNANFSVGVFSHHTNQQDLIELASMIEQGHVTPVIDQQYNLRQTPEAMRYLIAGHTQGKIVITMPHE